MASVRKADKEKASQSAGDTMEAYKENMEPSKVKQPRLAGPNQAREGVPS